MSTIEKNMSLTGDVPKNINALQKIGTAFGMLGLFIIVLAGFNVSMPHKEVWLAIALTALGGGIVLFAHGSYKNKLAGIKNDGVWFKSISSRGYLAWIAGIALTGFYIVLYFFLNQILEYPH